MKIIKGVYQKEGTDARHINVLVLEGNAIDVKGIDLKLLSEEDGESLKGEMMRHELEMKKYMKAFRHFKTERIRSEA